MLLPKGNTLLHGLAGFDSQICPVLKAESFYCTETPFISKNIRKCPSWSPMSILQQITLMTSAVAEMQTPFHSTQHRHQPKGTLHLREHNPYSQDVIFGKTVPLSPFIEGHLQPSTKHILLETLKEKICFLKSCDV